MRFISEPLGFPVCSQQLWIWNLLCRAAPQDVVLLILILAVDTKLYYFLLKYTKLKGKLLLAYNIVLVLENTQLACGSKKFNKSLKAL